MATADARPQKGRKTKRKVSSKNAKLRVQAPTDKPRSIFLFADGTGNSSAKLFKTNVWRMYEAIDLGGASPGARVQIGYYDNGVGTSAFRPLALLGGIFGIGLQGNVLRLYTFLCRNYLEGDRIYMFGFSRGAYTIRLLADFVAHQGILAAPDERLSYQVRAAYRNYRRVFKPNLPFGRLLVWVGRGLRDGFVGLENWIVAGLRKLRGKQPLKRPERHNPDIEFVGVWDTVAAYGGPFAEFTRGIDDWVFPLTMPDYHLNKKVKKARHALSLDDERDAFWPLLWDECYEQDLVDKGKVAADRLRQVWFAGVHSDVGGGYPDESLSYIPLLWMMDELGEDVDFLEEFVRRARDLANPYGPIHDSRAGPAAYYRYQPRKISAFMAPSRNGRLTLGQRLKRKWPGWKGLLDFLRNPRTSLEATASLRQPSAGGGPDWKGLLRSVCVHESVFARIIWGIDNYAPAALPAQFDIVRAPPRGKAVPWLKPETLKALDKTTAEKNIRFDQQEEAWDLVWWRRLIYFLTIGATISILVAPWSGRLQGLDKLCSDDRCFARSFLDIAFFFVPQSIRNSLNPWTTVPLAVILFAILIVALIAWGRRTERRFRDRVRQIWRSYLGQAALDQRKRSGLRPIRESLRYQGLIFILKWNLLPSACGIATILALLYAALIVISQTTYAVAEADGAICTVSKPQKQDFAGPVQFNTSDLCTDLGVSVTGGKPYRLTIEAISADPKIPWFDENIPADPRRGNNKHPMIMIAAAPLKRVTSANWMELITEVQDASADTWTRRLQRPGFGVDLRKHELTFVKNQTYETTFCPRWTGRLFLLVNDAAPLLSHYFYDNNRGGAQVSVAPAPDKRCA